jgi:CHAT domain-containing protein/predicted negative regulator of RcsB-dependent stress response
MTPLRAAPLALFLLLAFVLLAFLPVAAFASPGGELAARFVEVFRADDLAQLAQLVDPTQPDPRAWEEFREIVNVYDCIRIDRYDWSLVSQSSDRIELRVRIEGTGALKAAWHPERRLPRGWNLEARYAGGAWSIQRAMTDERRIAVAMTNAPSVADAERIASDAQDLDRARLIALYASELDDADADLDRFDYALSLARDAADLSTEIAVLRNYALQLTPTDPARMLVVARSAVELARSRGSRDDLARALLPFALSQIVHGDREAALEAYAASAALVDEVDDPIPSMKALHMATYAGRHTRSVLEILRSTESLLELSHRFQWEEGQELALFDLASVQTTLGNPDVARAHNEALIPLAERHGNTKFVTFAGYNLASFDSEAGRFAESSAQLRGILAHPSDELTAEVLGLLARNEIALGHFDEAEDSLQRAEAVSSTTPETRAALELTRSDLELQRGNVEKAIGSARAALRANDASVEHGELDNQASCRGALARALRAAGRDDEAIVELRETIALIESAQQQMDADALGLAAFLEKFAGFYVSLVELLVARGETDEAFRVAEQMKSRGLREAIASSHIDLSRSFSDEERAREKTLDGRVMTINRAVLTARQKQKTTDALEQQLTIARRELDGFRSEMRIRHPAVGRRRFDDAPLAELPAGDDSLALLEYVVAPGQVIGFVVKRGSPIQAVRVALAREDLQRDAAELEQLLAARSPEYRRKAKHLYATLVAPFEPYLPKTGTLAIIPDAILWTVPFHALVGSDGRYLVDRRPVFYAHSLHLLRQASTMHSSAPPRLLALGNPNIGAKARSTVRSAFRNTPLASLLDAEVEVRSVSSMYPSEGTRVYTRGAATEKAFKNEAARFNVIHIAAHAIVDDRAPLYSAIVLANVSADEDGLLEAREVVDLPLNADLAVLSACETARGRVGAGEGVIGLSWAFFAAGCPTTVVSQWRAESAATSRLMIAFHRSLRAGETVAESLRRAQMSVRRAAEYQHPFYWAPFIAVGAADIRSTDAVSLPPRRR